MFCESIFYFTPAYYNEKVYPNLLTAEPTTGTRLVLNSANSKPLIRECTEELQYLETLFSNDNDAVAV